MKALGLEKRLAARDRPLRRPLMYHRWSNLLFAHWEVDAVQVQRTLPEGLTVDTFEGRAFIGITPFFMEAIRPALAPPLPWLSYFLELNARTYVVDPQGNPGVWFYSLDCDQPIAVRAARWLMGLPYKDAKMRVRVDGAHVNYQSARRRETAEASFEYTFGDQEFTASPGTLEFFLLERYFLFSVRKGTLIRGQVHHVPYPLRNVDGLRFALNGFPDLGSTYQVPPAHVIASRGVDVEVFAAEFT